ncbi:BcPKS16, polyketide synthase [Xylariaceae sp. FL1272]|nr:BcPKS16, polyketide synthase [Xylariaceae sp. FL1272]
MPVSLKPSLAVFGPQTQALEQEYLDELRLYILSNPYLKRLAKDVVLLHKLWTLAAKYRPDIANVRGGLSCVQALTNWLAKGDSGLLASLMSGIVVLPLLVIHQISQYFQFLDTSGLKHCEFLNSIRAGKGGIQGYCAGLLPAFAVACARDEDDVAENAAKAMRLGLIIAAYAALGDSLEVEGATTVVMRLKYAGQGDEFIAQFPGTYIGAVTDPRTVAIVGSVPDIARLTEHAKTQGAIVQPIHLRGKNHNPENASLVEDAVTLCSQFEDVQLPNSDDLIVPVHSNVSGLPLRSLSLTREAIQTMLSSRCEWYTLLERVSRQMPRENGPHVVAMFGIGDSVSLAPFQAANLSITKVQVTDFIRDAKPADFRFSEQAVAIIGVACRLPGARHLDDLWNMTAKGESICVPTTAYPERVPIRASFRAGLDPSISKREFYGNFIEDVEYFDNSFFGISAKEAASMDPQQRLLLELGFQAMDCSGYLGKHRRQDFDNVGCFIGASSSEYSENINSNSPTAYAATGTLRSFLCGKLSYYFGWRGPSEMIDTACSSSMVAIHRACRALNDGECRMALAGGVNVISGVQNYLDLAKAGFLSPTGQCKPFDESADGYCRADGAGLVVLKPLDSALADGDQVLGVIAGVATNQSGLSTSITVPHSPSQIQLYKDVLRRAMVDPYSVSYVEAHGPGTQAGNFQGILSVTKPLLTNTTLGDPIEMESIREVFGQSQRSTVSIGSVKGNIGHTEAAAGVVGLIKVIAMLRHGKIPPLTSHRRLNPKIPSLGGDGINIPLSTTEWTAKHRAALVSSYGAAGSNAALICCEAPRNPRHSIGNNPSMIDAGNVPILISAHSTEALLRVKELIKNCHVQDTSLKDLAYTLAERRKHHSFRWSTTVSTSKELKESLVNLQPRDIHEIFEKPPPVIMAFGGQSSRRLDCSRSTYNSNFRFRQHLDDCDCRLKRLGFPPILPDILDRSSDCDTYLLHTGMFALQYSSAQCWIEGGLALGGVIGHSLGELTALVVSGVLSLEDGLRFVATRASLISSTWGDEKGAMLAIHSSEKPMDEIFSIADHPQVEVACYNSGHDQVIVGTTSIIRQLHGLFQQQPYSQNVRCQILDVSHGFHSSLTEPLLPGLATVAKELSYKQAAIPLETCTFAAMQGDFDAEFMINHTRQPVYFAHAVERIEKRLGACLWLEAGTESPIIPMLKRAINDKNHTFQQFSLDRSGAHLSAVVVSNLWKRGLQTTFWPFLTPRQSGIRQLWLPPYPYKGKKAWLPNVDHFSEFRDSLSSLDPPKAEPVTPLQLVTFLGAEGNENRFAVNTGTTRFQDIVSGHRVRNKPLCPAFMYAECACMALRIIKANDAGFANAFIHFEDLQFASPLGLDSNRHVFLTLRQGGGDKMWSYSLCSSLHTNTKSNTTTVHGTGMLKVGEDPKLGLYQKLIVSSMEQFEARKDLESLSNHRAYSLFAHVVTYSEMYQGIHSIILSRRHALATIEMPTGPFGVGESTMMDRCDTVTLDAFVQVLGLLINSSEDCNFGHCFVAVGIGSVVLSAACNLSANKSFNVYTLYTMNGENRAEGDVFVFQRDNKIVGVIEGVTFAKLPIKTLERMLDNANGTSLLEGLGRSSLGRGLTQATVDPSRPAEIIHQEAQEPSQKGLKAFPTVVVGLATEDVIQTTETTDASHTRARDIIGDVVGLTTSKIDENKTLRELGVDSLALVQLKGDLESSFPLIIDNNNINLDNKVHDIYQLLHDPASAQPSSNDELELTGLTTPLSSADVSETPHLQITRSRIADSAAEGPRHAWRNASIGNLVESLTHSELHASQMANACGLKDYGKTVHQRLNQIALAHIVEAFESLGTDFCSLKPGDMVQKIPHLPKHDLVVQRFSNILQKHGIIEQHGDEPGWYRTGNAFSKTSSQELSAKFVKDFPRYATDANLITLMGSKLAASLTGQIDPLELMFSNLDSQKTLEDFYAKSPMLTTATALLSNVIIRSLQSSQTPSIRIIEIGAGFGGTSKHLISKIQLLGMDLEYCFTDISHTLVARASKEFIKPRPNDSFEFQTLDIEADPPDHLTQRFDICLSVNCIHATRDKTHAIGNMKKLIRPNGYVIFMETTAVIDWHDVVWGLLDGWWQAPDKSYPLHPPQYWMKRLAEAGFDATYSNTLSADLDIQRIFIASISNSNLPIGARKLSTKPPQLKTVVYKKVDDVDVHADIYMPSEPVRDPMPIALLVHGGGHMTLSRKAVRPAQCAFLLAHGILPVSLDYRLCPEVNLIEGAMADVRDSLDWARNKLPGLLQPYEVLVDAKKVVLIGYSTGGHLAMTTAWTGRELDIEPPLAIVSFYGPTDYENTNLFSTPPKGFPRREMTTEEAIQGLSGEIATNHEVSSTTMDSSDFKWIKPGDPRSEVLLSLWHERNGLSLLVKSLNSLDGSWDWKRIPSRARVAAISPLAQVKRGTYTTPTYLVHGVRDDVVPYSSSLTFVMEMRARNLDCGILTVQGAGHIHDLDLKPGTIEWENEIAPAFEFLFKRLGRA